LQAERNEQEQGTSAQPGVPRATGAAVPGLSAQSGVLRAADAASPSSSTQPGVLRATGTAVPNTGAQPDESFGTAGAALHRSLISPLPPTEPGSGRPVYDTSGPGSGSESPYWHSNSLGTPGGLTAEVFADYDPQKEMSEPYESRAYDRRRLSLT
jgi:hypothetical protein